MLLSGRRMWSHLPTFPHHVSWGSQCLGRGPQLGGLPFPRAPSPASMPGIRVRTAGEGDSSAVSLACFSDSPSFSTLPLMGRGLLLGSRRTGTGAPLGGVPPGTRAAWGMGPFAGLWVGWGGHPGNLLERLLLKPLHPEALS